MLFSAFYSLFFWVILGHFLTLFDPFLPLLPSFYPLLPSFTHSIPSLSSHFSLFLTHSIRVTNVWVAGKRLLKDRVLTTIDEDALIEKIKEWRDVIADRSAKVPDHLRA